MSRRIRFATDWRQSLSADECVNQRCRRSLDTLLRRQRESTFTSRQLKSPTSIKTPSGPINLRAIPRRTRHAARWCLMTLAVCVDSQRLSSGAARDAARDESRDAGLEDQLAAQQATRTVQRYFPPTGTPAPTEPPAPALGQIAMTFGFRPDGTPDGSYASVPAGAGTVYVATRLTGLSVGQKVRAIVTDAWGNEVATTGGRHRSRRGRSLAGASRRPPGRTRSRGVRCLRLCRQPPVGVASVRCYRCGNVGATSARNAGKSPGAQ